MISSTASTFTVLKFGGTSVADPNNWKRIAGLIRRAETNREHPVLVCSALAGVTDTLQEIVAMVMQRANPHRELAEVDRLHRRLGRSLGLDTTKLLGPELAMLFDLAATQGANPSPRWQAQVLATGELMSTRVATEWLRSTGLRVNWADARELLQSAVAEDEPEATRYLCAECECAPSPQIQRQLQAADCDVTITQGFIAANKVGETVLLGRGGSDTSAAYLASILQGKRLEIWTDVPGLFTGDPRRAQGARLVPRLTYDEALVLGSLGAKVIHPRCLVPVKTAGIPLHIRWTRRPSVPGTIINGRPTARGVRAVTTRDRLCLIVMRRPLEWQPVGFMARVSACFERHQISMDLVSSSTSEIRATVDLAANPPAEAQLSELLRDLREVCEPELHRDVMCVSIVGSNISAALEHVSACLGLFKEPTVHLVSHAANDSHISFVVDSDFGQSLFADVHEALFSSKALSSTTASPALGARWSALQGASEIQQGSALNVHMPANAAMEANQ